MLILQYFGRCISQGFTSTISEEIQCKGSILCKDDPFLSPFFFLCEWVTNYCKSCVQKEVLISFQCRFNWNAMSAHEQARLKGMSLHLLAQVC